MELTSDPLTDADTQASIAKMRSKKRALYKNNKRARERKPYLIKLAQRHIFEGYTRDESIKLVAEEFGVGESKVLSYLVHYYDEIKAYAEEMLEQERARMEMEITNVAIQTRMDLAKKARRANERVDELMESKNDMAALKTVQHVHDSIGIGGNKGVKNVHFHLDDTGKQRAMDMLGFGEVIDVEAENEEEEVR